MSRALPPDYAGPIEDWSTLMRYLHALANHGRTVQVHAVPRDGTVEDAPLQVEGRLHHLRRDDSGCEWFAVSNEQRDDDFFVGGPWTHLQLEPARYAGGHIETFDDDDFFAISADFGDVSVVVSDANC